MGEAQNKVSPRSLDRLLQARGRFLAFLERQVGSREVAEDILQDAFVRGLERGGAIRDEETVVAWFYRVLRNAVIDFYRRRASAERAHEGRSRQIPLAEQPPDPFRREICQCVIGLLPELKPEYREALQLVDLADGNLRELAKHSGITANNAAVRVHRAREALRKQVTRACGACAKHGCLECDCGSASRAPHSGR